MPCYRCGARQSDPEQGKRSSWRRGVRREHQVLVCPDCSGAAASELDRCPGCGGTQLIRRLDQVECLSCGRSREAAGENPAPESQTPATGSPAPGSLAAEVASALDRVLGR
jgi:ribosomal protein L32